MKTNIMQIVSIWIRRVSRIPRRLVVAYFNLSRFHSSILRDKPYCSAIISHLNKREIKRSAVEIGCGLGDILLNLEYEHVVGFDHKPEVIRALEFISKLKKQKHKRHTFAQFRFSETQLEGKYDVIILCNWPHNFSTEKVNQILKNFYLENLNPKGEIIIDSISEKTPSHPNTHRLENLEIHKHAEVQIIGKFNIPMKGYENLKRTILCFRAP